MTMKTIFVGSGSDERGEVAAAMAILRAHGWTVTFDWPAAMEKEPTVLSPEHAYELAGAMEDAISHSQIVWIMLPKKKSEGAAAELGMARMSIRNNPGSPRALVVSGGVMDLGRIYPTRAKAQGRIFEDHADALTFLCNLR